LNDSFNYYLNMDATLWSNFSELQEMMSVFEGCRGRTILPLEVLVQRPDGVVDVCLYAREVPFMPPDWTDLSVFDHPGIVHTVLVPYPQQHFLIQGYVEAIQSCVATFIVCQMDIRMDQFATQQRMIARQSTPAVPPVLPGVAIPGCALHDISFFCSVPIHAPSHSDCAHPDAGGNPTLTSITGLRPSPTRDAATGQFPTTAATKLYDWLFSRLLSGVSYSSHSPQCPSTSDVIRAPTIGTSFHVLS
jgi:hypothetical protein